MKAAINLEFTDDELRKYAEDVGRRWGLNFIHDVIRHLGALKIDPGTGQAVMNAVSSAVAGAFSSKPTTDPGPTAEPQTGPLPEDPSAPSACARWEASADLDEAWVCCRCRVYNGLHRSACRRCDHERCDVVVPPPPPPSPPRQNDPSVQ